MFFLHGKNTLQGGYGLATDSLFCNYDLTLDTTDPTQNRPLSSHHLAESVLTDSFLQNNDDDDDDDERKKKLKDLSLLVSIEFLWDF